MVPDSETAFDDRKLDIAADGTFEWRFTPDTNAQLVIREVYNDWSAQRGTFAIARTDTAGTAPPPLTKELIEKRYATAGKQLVQRVKTWLQFPKWFYDNLPVNTMIAPRLTPGGLATQYSSVGHFDLTPEQALVITLPVTDAPYLGFQLGSLWYISLDYINHQTSLNGTQAQADPDGKIRIVVSDREPRRDQLGGDARASQGLPAVPLAAGVPRADRGRRPHRGAGRPRHGGRQAARTTSTTRSPKTTGARGSRCARNKLATGWWDSSWAACSRTRSW